MNRLKHRVGRPSNYRRVLQTEQWREVCSRVRMRDGHRCRVCGCRYNLEVHHQTYYVNGKSIVGHESDHLDCLLTVCERCHKTIHGRN